MVLDWRLSKEDRDRVQQEMLYQTEEATRAMRSVGCGNHLSSIADAIVLQLSNHTAITLRRLHDEAEGSIEDAVKILPLFSVLALEIAHCQHANASRLLADALRLFGDRQSDRYKVREYYSSQYDRVEHVLDAYIEQLNNGGGAFLKEVSQLNCVLNW